MKEAIKPKNWCNSPYYVRELGDLFKVGARVDAWREFLNSPKIEVLRNLGMSVCSFNQFSMFDTLIIMLECTEDAAIAAIESLMVPGHEQPAAFYRESIHDERAWAKLPLSCFADADGFNDRDNSQDVAQYDILKFNQMPLFEIGIKKDWEVSEDCFTFSHKIKVDKKAWPVEKKRYAQISFNHPHLDRRFEGNQHVASGTFAVGMDIAAVKAQLWTEAMAVCAKHSVIVQKQEKL